jgi:hypothetical protein
LRPPCKLFAPLFGSSLYLTPSSVNSLFEIRLEVRPTIQPRYGLQLAFSYSEYRKKSIHTFDFIFKISIYKPLILFKPTITLTDLSVLSLVTID